MAPDSLALPAASLIFLKFISVHVQAAEAAIGTCATGTEAGRKDAHVLELGRNLAMQVAASNPLCLSREHVPAEGLEREKAIYREEVKGKFDIAF